MDYNELKDKINKEMHSPRKDIDLDLEEEVNGVYLYRSLNGQIRHRPVDNGQ